VKRRRGVDELVRVATGTMAETVAMVGSPTEMPPRDSVVVGAVGSEAVGSGPKLRKEEGREEEGKGSQLFGREGEIRKGKSSREEHTTL